jgi:hypothetical protein
MSVPTQRISPGNLQDAFQKEAARLAAAGRIAKIWSKQPELRTTRFWPTNGGAVRHA